jgi:S1-C subfamily serine protease
MLIRALVIIAAVVIVILGLVYYRSAEEGLPEAEHPTTAALDAALKAVVSVWSYTEGQVTNQGSAFIVSRNGLILTSLHVLEGGDSNIVRFDGSVSASEYKAKIIAFNKDYDIALLKIDANGLETLPLAPGKARQGDSVRAMGYPSSQGLDAERMTITSGIVSRINPDENGVPLIIQTDAYITYGSSGGPLYDLDAGGVIGICTWSQHDESDKPLLGINYALSIEKVLEVFGEYL